VGLFEMILLDTHIWVWWVNNDPQLTPQQRQWIEDSRADGLGLSIFSCWEVAKLLEKGRIQLSLSLTDWLTAAVSYPGIRLIDLTLPIIVQSTQLVGFHADPADQLIVATALTLGCPLLTADRKILNYPAVTTLQ
jgi:PIN domain nuclease of toxin-antitoxin system